MTAALAAGVIVGLLAGYGWGRSVGAQLARRQALAAASVKLRALASRYRSASVERTARAIGEGANVALLARENLDARAAGVMDAAEIVEHLELVVPGT